MTANDFPRKIGGKPGPCHAATKQRCTTLTVRHSQSNTVQPAIMSCSRLANKCGVLYRLRKDNEKGLRIFTFDSYGAENSFPIGRGLAMFNTGTGTALGVVQKYGADEFDIEHGRANRSIDAMTQAGGHMQASSTGADIVAMHGMGNLFLGDFRTGESFYDDATKEVGQAIALPNIDTVAVFEIKNRTPRNLVNPLWLGFIRLLPSGPASAVDTKTQYLRHELSRDTLRHPDEVTSIDGFEYDGDAYIVLASPQEVALVRVSGDNCGIRQEFQCLPSLALDEEDTYTGFVQLICSADTNAVGVAITDSLGGVSYWWVIDIGNEAKVKLTPQYHAAPSSNRRAMAYVADFADRRTAVIVHSDDQLTDAVHKVLV